MIDESSRNGCVLVNCKDPSLLLPVVVRWLRSELEWAMELANSLASQNVTA